MDNFQSKDDDSSSGRRYLYNFLSQLPPFPLVSPSVTDAPSTTMLRLADTAHDGEGDAVSFPDIEAAIAGRFNDMDEDVPASSSTTTSSPLPPPPSQYVSTFFVGHARGNLEADAFPSSVPPTPLSDHSTAEAAARYLVPLNEENTHPVFSDNWRGDEEGTLGEDEDDDAPQPPELIAEAFEGPWDEEDDCTPLPPDMVAASFEAVKPKLIDDDDAPAPVPFEGRGDEEEKREEVEDEYAPLPPEMIAASHEGNDAANQEAAKRTECHRLNQPVNCADLHEVIDNDETHVTTAIQGSLLNPSSLPNQQPSAATGVQVGAFSITPPMRDDQPSLIIVCDDTIRPNLESISPRPNIPTNHSVPLLEARLVPDVPDEPVYDAYPMPDTQENDARRGLTKKGLYITLGLGSLVFVAMASTIATLLSKSQREPDVEDPNKILPTIPLTNFSTEIPTFAPTNPPTKPLIWKQRGQVLLGDADGDRLGTSLVLSADATILAVGAPGDFNNNNIEGYVRVYRINDDGWNWTQLGQTIYGKEIGDKLGWDVDLSPGGNILAIGAPGSYGLNDRTGYVRVCYLEGDDSSSFSWKTLGEDIIGEELGDEFGESVSVSDDGQSVAVGADDNDGNGTMSGSVRIYHFEDNMRSWEQIGRDIDGDGADDHSGLSVSLSGATVAIGAPFNDHNGDDSGHVRVHQLNSDGSSWEQLGHDFGGDEKHDFFGNSVALSSDGKTLAIGAPGNWNSAEEGLLGYVRVFYLNDTTSSWEQVGQDIRGESSGDYFGFSLALSADGKTLAVGAYANDNDNSDESGHVRVYRIYDAIWTQIGDDIDGESAFDEAGYSVSLSADGNTVAIGSRGKSVEGVEARGCVRVFAIE